MAAITVKAIHELPVYIEGGTDLSVCSYMYTLYQPCVAMFVVRSVYDPFYVQEMVHSTSKKLSFLRSVPLLQFVVKSFYKRQNSNAHTVKRLFYEDET